MTFVLHRIHDVGLISVIGHDDEVVKCVKYLVMWSSGVEHQVMKMKACPNRVTILHKIKTIMLFYVLFGFSLGHFCEGCNLPKLHTTLIQ